MSDEEIELEMKAIPVDAATAWRAVDPAHRGAVLLNLLDLARRITPTKSDIEAGAFLPDAREQNVRRRALAMAYDKAIVLLDAIVRAQEDEGPGSA